MLHKWKIGKLEKRASQEVWEADYELIENEGLFEEYLEMGMFGVCVCFFTVAEKQHVVNRDSRRRRSYLGSGITAALCELCLTICTEKCS